MMRFTLLLFVVLLSGAHSLSAQETADTRGITSEIKLEEVIFGHLTELNDKFKLRATELTFAPGGYLECITTLGPGLGMCFPAKSPSLREGGRRSTRLGTISLKRGTSHIPLRIRQTCRSTYCFSRFFRKTGQVRRLFHLIHRR